ncbi:MAG: acyl dehydratase [Burkholderiales bacterium]|jgi:acyl dehydratase|nr:acyl dehydratase [Burkholderiales bacterium]MDP4909588.1 acyl dehydratase [Burkholderiaceae bacterium]MDP4969171.1 acyl dehydratase [Burkholderiaceae bacterium]
MALGKTPYFEDVAVGTAITTLEKGPLTTAHLMRWSAAMENWHKIHYDKPFAMEHDKLPGLLINGSLKQQFVLQLLADWAGSQGWVWKASFQFRAMNLVEETIRVWGRVIDKREGPDFGLIDIELGIINDADKESTPGTAIVALPFKNGQAVPYPFIPPKL